MTTLSPDEIDQMLQDLNEMHTPDEVEDFGKFPDATYQGRLEKIYVEESKKGRNQCVMIFEIVSGSYQGREQRKYCGMETAENLDFLTRDIRTMGISSFIWTEFPSILPKLLDVIVEFELVTKKGFQNMYIQKRISVAGEGKSEKKKSQPIFKDEEPLDVPDDDIPF